MKKTILLYISLLLNACFCSTFETHPLLIVNLQEAEQHERNLQIFNPATTPLVRSLKPQGESHSYILHIREELGKVLTKSHFQEVGVQLRRLALRLAQKDYEVIREKGIQDTPLFEANLFFACLERTLTLMKGNLSGTATVARLDATCLDSVLKNSVEQMPPSLIEKLCQGSSLFQPTILSMDDVKTLNQVLSPLFKDTSVLKSERLKSFIVAIGRKRAFAYGDYSWDGALIYSIQFIRGLCLVVK